VSDNRRHLWLDINSIGLHHSPDGITNPKYKLQCFITTQFFCKEKNALVFNRDRCCHLALCLQLTPFHSVHFLLKARVKLLKDRLRLDRTCFTDFFLLGKIQLSGRTARNVRLFPPCCCHF